MDFNFNIELAENYCRKKALKGLDVAGAVVTSKAIQNVHNTFEEQTGNLAGHIFHKVIPEEFKTLIIANTPYARIQELGGDIKPVDAKALAIPVHPDAKKTAIPEGKTIKDIFPDLVLIKRKNAHPLLVRTSEKRFDIMFVLVSEVTLKAKPYLRPALYESRDLILKAFGKN